jgi:hypothetical protein
MPTNDMPNQLITSQLLGGKEVLILLVCSGVTVMNDNN